MKASGDAVVRRARAILAALLMAVGLVGVQASLAPAQQADAADLSQFQAGNIIADSLFFNPNTMSVAEIQAFLNIEVPHCTAGYTCLKDFRQTTWTIAQTPMCSTYTGAANETAATIIYNVAQSCGISPKVILVVLEKEQSLVTSTAPGAGRYAAAMGAGCPDTAPCDANYRTFFQQVQYGAYLLKRYTEPAGTGPGTEYYTRYDLMKPVGQVSQIQYDTDPTCGTKAVYIANQATHALYIYTPYTPNQASLNAGYGTGDDCSTYGNRNFFNFYTDWFGSTQVPQLTTTGAAALGTAQVGQYLNGYPGYMTPKPDTVSCVWMRAGTVIAGATTCLYQAQAADVGQQLSVTVTSTKAGYQTLTQTSSPTQAITVAPTPVSGINSLTPARLADTRSTAAEHSVDGRLQGTGALAPGQTLTVPVLGRAGIPTTGVGSVILNLTVTAPTASSFLTVYPTGQTRPWTSSINFNAKQTIANTVVAQVGSDGSISVFNSDGSTQVIVDVTGWLSSPGGVNAVTPARLADTRSSDSQHTVDGQVQGVGALGAGETLRVPVLGRAGIPSAGVGAVVLNVTATAPTASSYLTVYPTGQARPWTSNVNFVAKQTIANTVIVPVGADGSITVYNSDGSTQVIVDISGWLAAPGGVNSVPAARIADTRISSSQHTVDGLMQGGGPLTAGQTLKVPVLGRAGVPASGVGAVVLNVTVTAPTVSSFLTVYPTGQTRPWTSSINFNAKQTIANTVIAHVGSDGSISIYNADGSTQVIVDITGWLPGA